MKCPVCHKKVELKEFKHYCYLKCLKCSWQFEDVNKDLTIKYFIEHGGKYDSK